VLVITRFYADQIKGDEVEGYVACIGDTRNGYEILVGKRDGKRQLVRSLCRWEDNIKMKLRETGCETLDWVPLGRIMVQC
jgi:hypothetical protein